VLSNCVAFFTQRENEAYGGHCDTDDVLVFQLEGRKTWQLFEAQQRRYLGVDDQSAEQLGPVKKEITMRPGDAMYVRAGVPHLCHARTRFQGR
jgi:ribosomal protein L16 Arg81 hydroxylase